MSKLFDDKWLGENNLLTEVKPQHSLKDLLQLRGPRKLTTITPEATVEDAIRLMQATGISQLPVLKEGKPAGSVQEVTLARVLHDHRDPSEVKIGEVMARALPTLEATVHLDEAYRLLLAGNTGVLATEAGQVIGIVTRIDLIEYWNKQRQDVVKTGKG
jgi:cystathionine beta-synthase